MPSSGEIEGAGKSCSTGVDKDNGSSVHNGVSRHPVTFGMLEGGAARRIMSGMVIKRPGVETG
ncbi:MAG: hypothetical protein PHU23_11265 [Dehalococcoidales bacterium]|nr:hypothetical protein [Dehalococcoidales bacterium]